MVSCWQSFDDGEEELSTSTTRQETDTERGEQVEDRC